ncbi:hypothetical protein J3R82DRAFT_7573 [Butyriboletus roseoflavus]|nr:hypothetical protein J3R82DRAFT_7573 [Butyriboletus roseoflavus]
MDRVYGWAALTIIAASGKNVRDGLAGLRTRSRIPNQHVECVQGLHLSIPCHQCRRQLLTPPGRREAGFSRRPYFHAVD